MTEQEKLTNYETLRHIRRVQALLNQIVVALLERGEEHDATKLRPPELSAFVEYTPKLAQSEFGSEEYQRFLQEMRPALEHHYAHNRHHPEHFPNGVEGMTLVDVMEMLCDWMAAVERHQDGDIERSFTQSQERFGLTDQLIQILRNTAEMLKS